MLGCVYEPDGTVGASTYPLAKKAHSLEFLRSIAHLRPRTKVSYLQSSKSKEKVFVVLVHTVL